MLAFPRPLRTLLVGATAAVTIGAGMTAFLAAPAQADVAAKITIAPASQTGSAGTCLAYTVTVTDAFGRPASDTGTIDVTISEDPESATQDVDFCVPTGATSYSAYSEFPSYVNAGVISPDACEPDPFTGETGCTQYYAPGPSVTTNPADSPGAPPSGQADNPDAPANSSPPTVGTPPRPGNVNNNANPSGTDYASFQYNTGSNNSHVITFGIAGLVPGGATITANHRERDLDSNEATATFRTGGKAGTQEAANAARNITVESGNSVKPIGAPTHTFTVKITNATGDTLLGVVPSYVVQSGPGTTSTPRECPATDNSGLSTCTYTAQSSGVDTLLFYVNQTTGTPTSGPDSGEPRANATATTTAPPVGSQFAYTIDLTPDQASTSAGNSRTFTAAVLSSSGAPAQGVAVNFVENGPGVFRGAVETNGSSVITGTTDNTGRASVIVDTAGAVPGTQTITATINNPAGTECQNSGGNCTDTSTHTVTTATGSPSLTGTATASPTATATATATATPTATASPSRSATPSASPTTSPGQCSVTPTVTLAQGTINATGSAGVTVNAPAGSRIQLLAYSQPDTTYRVVRTATVDSDGTEEFTVRPPTNTRLYAQIEGCTTDDVRFSKVLNVRTTLFLAVARNGKQDYTFSGDSLPARRGGLIVSLYRVTDTGRQVLTSQARASSTTGDWQVRRVFTGTGRFDFIVRTGQDLQNAPGQSNTRSLLIF